MLGNSEIFTGQREAAAPLGQKVTLVVEPGEEGIRVDKLAASKLTGVSRSRIQRLIEEGQVLLNGKTCKANTKAMAGAVLEILIPASREAEVAPENIPLDILYEDQDVLVINKPQGMVVHPAPGNYAGTLVNALLYHCKDLSGIGGTKRPGIVHRLDKDTSGVLVVAKNDLAHQKLAAQLKKRTMQRIYLAIVHGNIREEGGRIEAPIGRHPVDRKKMAVVERNAKEAVTEYEVVERFGDYTLVRARLHTGRTHQIRVHLAYIKHPVLGDPVYGPRHNPFGLKVQLLHAYRLCFIHPRTGEPMTFEAPLPEQFQRVLQALRGMPEINH